MVLRRQAARSTSKSTGPMLVSLSKPRQCLIEITFRQLHLFPCGVMGCNREQHLSLSPLGVDGSA